MKRPDFAFLLRVAISHECQSKFLKKDPVFIVLLRGAIFLSNSLRNLCILQQSILKTHLPHMLRIFEAFGGHFATVQFDCWFRGAAACGLGAGVRVATTAAVAATSTAD